MVSDYSIGRYGWIMVLAFLTSPNIADTVEGNEFVVAVDSVYIHNDEAVYLPSLCCSSYMDLYMLRVLWVQLLASIDFHQDNRYAT
jgi:hypothetical protein